MRIQGVLLFVTSGMSWWRRLYIVTISWESEQTIFQKNHEFRIHGTSEKDKLAKTAFPPLQPVFLVQRARRPKCTRTS